MKKLLVLTVFIAGLFLACSYDRYHHYRVENRTTGTVTFDFNGNRSLPAGGSMTVSVNAWDAPPLPPPHFLGNVSFLGTNDGSDRRIVINPGSRIHTIDYVVPLTLVVRNTLTIPVRIWAGVYLGNNNASNTHLPYLDVPAWQNGDNGTISRLIYTRNPQFTVRTPGVFVNQSIRGGQMIVYIR